MAHPGVFQEYLAAHREREAKIVESYRRVAERQFGKGADARSAALQRVVMPAPLTPKKAKAKPRSVNRTKATFIECVGVSETIRKLRKRDANMCGICNLFVDPRERATRDHIIPRSHGGTNALSNLRLAHADCNSRRGDRDCPACDLGECERLSLSNESGIT